MKRDKAWGLKLTWIQMCERPALSSLQPVPSQPNTQDTGVRRACGGKW